MTGSFVNTYPQFKQYMGKLLESMTYEDENQNKKQHFILPSFYHLLQDLMKKKIPFVRVLFVLNYYLIFF